MGLLDFSISIGDIIIILVVLFPGGLVANFIKGLRNKAVKE